jgi:hypothetical protein
LSLLERDGQANGNSSNEIGWIVPAPGSVYTFQPDALEELHTQTVKTQCSQLNLHEPEPGNH